MYHGLFRDAKFWAFLLTIDEDLARVAREGRCPFCGGRLHGAKYPRQPRGADKLPEEYRSRLSFCCDQDGCRKRTTPPSVRFLGRKVYLGVVVVLVAAMRQGATTRRVRELSSRFDVDRRTIVRWRVFWTEHFPQTACWKIKRARFMPVPEDGTLPRSLLDSLVHGDDDQDGWGELMKFFSPITITGGLAIKPSE
jgi:hypothetical protein